MHNHHQIAPCLWFDHQAEEAAKYYSRHLQELEDHRRVSHYTEVGQRDPRPARRAR